MIKILLSSTLMLAFSFTAFSQKDADTAILSELVAKDILSQIKFDSTQFLRTSGNEACKCIDSISISDKNSAEISADVFKCIDKQVGAYQISMQVFHALKSGSKSINVSINTDNNTNEYKQYYFQLETWLMDSCASLQRAVKAENAESRYSTSKNPDAADQYNLGIEKFENKNFKDALPFFEKAVAIDPKFAFAWDNIGVCNRQLGNYDEALKAYKKSLEYDPKGKTPLQNIPIVYQYQKKYDKAIKAYEDMLDVYPNDPESFYGIGVIYIYYKDDLEQGLQNMCKAYNLYIKLNSPYRVDAEKNIQYIYSEFKKSGKVDLFNKILKENNLNPQ